tara:strand:- start:1981 stop:2136 length:156 start_codon:yes stop_codon:yes gene_type:complete
MSNTYRKAKTGARAWRIDDNIDYDEVKSSLRNTKIRADLHADEDMRMEASE